MNLWPPHFEAPSHAYESMDTWEIVCDSPN